MKFLLVANTAWNLFNFRINLISSLQQAGIEVLAVSPDDRFVPLLKKRGISWREWNVSRKGTNPLVEWKSIASLTKIYQEEQPDLVHHFTIKSVLYGTKAARQARLSSIVNSVTGLGHMFVSNRWQTRFLRPFIRNWYARSLTGKDVKCIFQNPDDLQILSEVIPEIRETAILTKGSGVDIKRFSPQNKIQQPSDRLTVMFTGRLLREKGICEFIDAANILKDHSIRFVVCGAPDTGNPSSLSLEEVRQWEQQNKIEFIGHADRIEQVLAEADIIVLPSHREGTPRVLLESAAMGKPIITTDVPGCREVVRHLQEGLLVPPKNSTLLAKSILELVQSKALRSRLGAAAHQRALQEFDERQVIAQIWDVYQQLIPIECDEAFSKPVCSQ